jgi:hypothetical protein
MVIFVGTTEMWIYHVFSSADFKTYPKYQVKQDTSTFVNQNVAIDYVELTSIAWNLKSRFAKI